MGIKPLYEQMREIVLDDLAKRDRTADLLLLARDMLSRLERNKYEYGSWWIDPKRPYGNSGLYQIGADICELLGIKMGGFFEGHPAYTDEQTDYAHALFDELGPFIAGECLLVLREKAW